MDSHANGHANGHGAEESFVASENLGAGAGEDAAADDKAMNGAAFGTVGEWLAARRRVLGLSLEEVAETTRVREDYLVAIEDMDARRMPLGPYAPGFVRTYAIHLELDPEAVTTRFREEMSPRRLRTPVVAPEREPLRVSVPPRVWGVLLGIAALIALVALGWRPRETGSELAVPAVPEGLSDWVAAEVQSRRSSAAPELVVGPDLGLRARVPVWLEARTTDGEVLISRTLEAGEIWTAPRVPGVLVSADNGAGVDVLLDGIPQGRLGEAALPISSWRADAARGLTAPEPPVVEPPIEEPAAAEVVAVEPEPAAPAAEEEPEQILSDLTDEEALVVPDLPPSDQIAEEALPALVIGQGSFVPDPDETAAAEGRLLDPEADAPDVE